MTTVLVRSAPSLPLTTNEKITPDAAWLGTSPRMSTAAAAAAAAVAMKADAAALSRILGSGRFSDSVLLGRGTFGRVYRMHDAVSSKSVAVKVYAYDTDGFRPDCLREMSFFRELRHDNIVMFVDACTYDTAAFVVMEIMSTDLTTHIKSSPMMHKSTRLRIGLDMARGLDYMHSCGIMHRDIKSANILVDKRGVAKLSDFGTARRYETGRQYTLPVSTRWYESPEMLLGDDHYGPATDVWSWACTFIEVMTSLPFACGQSRRDQLHLVMHLIGGVPSCETWPGIDTYPNYKKAIEHTGADIKKRDPPTIEENIPRFANTSTRALLDEAMCPNPEKRASARWIVHALEAIVNDSPWKVSRDDPDHGLAGGGPTLSNNKRKRNSNAASMQCARDVVDRCNMVDDLAREHAVDIINQYAATTVPSTMTARDTRVLGVASLHMSCKVNMVEPPRFARLAHASGVDFLGLHEVLRMEKRIMQAVPHIVPC